jgi:hypothetical protein
MTFIGTANGNSGMAFYADKYPTPHPVVAAVVEIVEALSPSTAKFES